MVHLIHNIDRSGQKRYLAQKEKITCLQAFCLRAISLTERFVTRPDMAEMQTALNETEGPVWSQVMFHLSPLEVSFLPLMVSLRFQNLFMRTFSQDPFL
jgi:hypothetical protein